ncbi:MAG: hypothetical protein FWC92_10770 [Defluviitaleaceae bacterium]|nr:hypothetical protein [Defluviitaleaceae bacterium]
MFCSACGSNCASASSSFCPTCGARLHAAAAASPQRGIAYIPPNAANNEAPGKILLLVTGILFIVFGVINFFMGGLLAILSVALGTSFESMFDILLPFYSVLRGSYSFVIGILGIVYRARPQKAGLCKIFAIISIALNVLDIIFGLTIAGTGAVDGTFFVTVVVMALPALAIPSVYFLGAVKNHNAKISNAEAMPGGHYAAPPSVSAPRPMYASVSAPAQAVSQPRAMTMPVQTPPKRAIFELRDYNGNITFRIVDEKCYDTNNTWLFTKHDGNLYDATGRWRYEIHGDRVYDTNGNWVYTVHQYV